MGGGPAIGKFGQGGASGRIVGAVVVVARMSCLAASAQGSHVAPLGGDPGATGPRPGGAAAPVLEAGAVDISPSGRVAPGVPGNWLVPVASEVMYEGCHPPCGGAIGHSGWPIQFLCQDISCVHGNVACSPWE